MRISIRLTEVRYICPLGVLNKYTSDTSLSMCPTGDPYKSKSAISRRSECYKYMIRIRIKPAMSIRSE